MLKPIALFSLLLFSSFTFAQSPSWQWGIGAGGNNSDKGMDICVDANGNSYVTGFLQSSGITFGNFDLDNTLSNNTSDAFLVKFDPSGNALWAQAIGGTGYQSGMAVAITPDEGVVMAMTFENTVTVGTQTHTSPGGSALLVAKFNGDGDVLWSYSAGSESQVYVYDVAVANDGRVAACGSFTGDNFSSGAGSSNNAGGLDMYVVVLDEDGNAAWSAFAGNGVEESARAVAFTSSGDVVVGGYYTSGSLMIAGSTIINADDNDNDIFLARYGSDGSGQWAIGQGTTDTETLMDLAIDAQDQIIIAGTFDAPDLDLLGTTLVNTSPNVDDSWIDHFVAKLDGNGALIWAVSGGGTQHEFLSGVAIGADGDVYVCGEFESQNAVFGGSTISASGGSSPYVVKYSADGEAIWAVTAGGAQSDYSERIAVDAGGGVLVTGWFNGDLELGSNAIESEGDNDVWIGKLGGTVGLSEIEGAQWATVHVDRLSGLCNVESDRRIDAVLVIDAAGRSVHSSSPGSDRANFILEKAGAYLVKVRSGELQETLKILR